MFIEARSVPTHLDLLLQSIKPMRNVFKQSKKKETFMNPKKNEPIKSNKNNSASTAMPNDKHSPAEHQKYLAAQKANAKVTAEKSEKKV